MSRERISIDALLSQQSGLRPGTRATVKADSDDRVKVTPVTDGEGCACSYAITVNKADIDAVTPTGDTHDCCGERLLVVEVAFANETVADIFRQLSEGSAKASQGQSLVTEARRKVLGGMRRRSQMGRRAVPWLREDGYECDRCLDNYDACLETCYNGYVSPEDQSRCIQRCFDYLYLCWTLC